MLNRFGIAVLLNAYLTATGVFIFSLKTITVSSLIIACAQAIIKDDTVIVFNEKIKTPVAVRYAFNNTAIPNLFSKDGLPINLFRTDDWEIDTNTKSNN